MKRILFLAAYLTMDFIMQILKVPKRASRWKKVFFWILAAAILLHFALQGITCIWIGIMRITTGGYSTLPWLLDRALTAGMLYTNPLFNRSIAALFFFLVIFLGAFTAWLRFGFRPLKKRSEKVISYK